MNKIGLFLSCAFLLLFLASSAEAETFASVPLYISGEPEGTLSVDSPSGSNVESVVIASNAVSYTHLTLPTKRIV